ncbi:MAG: Na+/H+ antiporter NhaC family protein [Firmicutes bacterium]|nr:Na+/H+ antiporter NhaC family protein [Bacillota bacterium]
MIEKKKANAKALLPIGVFVVLYLGLGIIFEYVMKIEMGFYNVPIIVVFGIALMVAMFQSKDITFDDQLTLMGRGIGDKTIVIMILIFLEAGIFVGVVGRGSAQSVAYCLLSIFPAQFVVPVLFLIACLVSISMGTSVGTITLIVPIGVSLAQATGLSVPLCVATIIGGAMFGDNLSFISDTTIAACQGQGCQMKDKFRENFKIAVPAAILTLIIITAVSMRTQIADYDIPAYNLIQIVPYIIVLGGGIIGINVLIVLLLGIISGAVIMLATGATTAVDMIGSMGAGAAGMFETIMVAVLVSAICALVRNNGGFEALLNGLYKIFKGEKGGQIGMGILVLLLDIATANNTVAIVIANPIATEMSEQYGISNRRAASILDTFSCVSQGVLPYGAQMLIALSASATLGANISAFNVIGFLFYPMFLLLSTLVFIIFFHNRKAQ